MGKSTDIIIRSKQLLELNTVDENGLAKDFSDKTFWYYTTLETAKLILNNKCIYINNLTKMNDRAEAEYHVTNADRTYALCFCNSKSEKIPMWYLYSGLTGKGVSIGFTPSVMLEFIRSIDRVRCVDDNRELVKNEDYSINAAWVYYRDSDTNRVAYKNKWYKIKDHDHFFNENNLFVKDYPWEYEKEFRIAISTKTAPTNSQKLSISIPESVIAKLKIKVAPEMSMDIDSLESFKETELIREIPLSNISKSRLKIQMGLFERNIVNLKNSWESLLEDGYFKDDYEFFYKSLEPYLNGEK